MRNTFSAEHEPAPDAPRAEALVEQIGLALAVYPAIPLLLCVVVGVP